MKRSLLVLGLFLFFVLKSFAVLKTWVGPGGSNWNNSSNWLPSGIPTFNDTAYFNGGGLLSVVIDAGTNQLASLVVTNNSIINFTAVASRQIVIGNGGTPVTSLRIDLGSTLSLGGGSPVSIQTYANAATNNAYIYGTLILNDGASQWNLVSFPLSFTIAQIYGTIQVSSTNTGSIIPSSNSSYLKFFAGSFLDWKRNGGLLPGADYKDGSTINFTGITSSMITLSSSSNYNGLIIWNCTSQTATVSGSSANILPSSSYTIDSLRIVNTGLGTVRLATNPNGYTIGHLEVQGGTLELSAPASATSTGSITTDFKITGGNVIGNATYSFDNLSSYPMTLTVNGNLSMSGASTFNLTNRPTANLPGGAFILNVKGNASQSAGVITCSSAFGSQNQINMNGTSVQNLLITSLSGMASLVITNTSGVSLQGNLLLPYYLNLQSGYLQLNGFDCSINYPNITQAVVSPTPKVVTNGFGKMKVLSMGAGTSIVLPIAHAASSLFYNPLTIAPLPGAATNDYYARVENGNNPIGTYNNKTINRTWIINSATATLGTVNLSFQYAASDANLLCNPAANMELGHFIGTAWNLDPSTNILPTGTDPYTVGTFAPSGLDSSFVIGNIGSILALQQSVFLSAQKQNDKAFLNWHVGQIDNNATFEVERSLNGLNYAVIKTMPSSSITTYIYNEAVLSPGLNYFRIKMIDKTGRITYSNISAMENHAEGVKLMAMMPNLVRTASTVVITSPKHQTVQLLILDWTGKRIQQSIYALSPGENYLPFEANHLAAGEYQLVYFGVRGIQTLRFIRL